MEQEPVGCALRYVLIFAAIMFYKECWSLEVDNCKLPVDRGPCRAIIIRYFYNPTTETCETFTYGGCNGNANNFATVEECHQQCSPEKISADCRNKSCPPCHDCQPDENLCGPTEELCQHYSCRSRCQPCEKCSEHDECYDPTPRWCRLFNACQMRTCQRYPDAICQPRPCDCFNVDFVLANGTVFDQKDCMPF